MPSYRMVKKKAKNNILITFHFDLMSIHSNLNLTTKNPKKDSYYKKIQARIHAHFLIKKNENI